MYLSSCKVETNQGHGVGEVGGDLEGIRSVVATDDVLLSDLLTVHVHVELSNVRFIAKLIRPPTLQPVEALSFQDAV